MGKEAQVRALFAEGADEGRLQHEPPTLLFRGAGRRVSQGEQLAGLRAEGGDLVLADGSRFVLGEKAAASWAHAILHPKGRAEKLGLKAGQRVAVLGVEDRDLPGEIAERGAVLVEDLAGLDLLFYAADSAEALERIAGLVPALAEKGAIWIVSRKGKAAAVKDIEVMAAARTAGLVDSQVVGFSDTHTALRFTKRRP
jgi:hypothetical protein